MNYRFITNKRVTPFHVTESLDTSIFDENLKVKEHIRRNLLNLKNEIVQNLLNQDVFYEPKFVILTGSLTGTDWDEYSDIDLHLGIDYAEYEDPVIAKNFFNAVAKNFNDKNYQIANRKVELYFQDIHEFFLSPGIYDLINEIWIKEPALREPKEKSKEINRIAQKLYDEVEKFEKEYHSLDKTFFSIRKFKKKLQQWFEKIKEMRVQSIKHAGMYSVGNLVFKELRRNGTFEKFANLRDKVERDLIAINND